jgi:hypothetical protein
MASTQPASTCHPAAVARIRVVEWPTTNTLISLSDSLNVRARISTPAMKARWSQPSSMCSIPNGMKPHTDRSAASPPMPWACAGLGTATRAAATASVNDHRTAGAPLPVPGRWSRTPGSAVARGISARVLSLRYVTRELVRVWSRGAGRYRG